MKRLWGVRHVRYWWLRRELVRWFDAYQRAGGIGWHISEADWDYLDRVWTGEE